MWTRALFSPRFAWCVWLVMFVPACTKGAAPAAERRYRLQGQVIAVAPNHLEATVKHEEIKSFMPAMTMPYKVKDRQLLDGIVPGDLINATLVVASNDAFLNDVRKVGRAPLEQPPGDGQPGFPGPSGPPPAQVVLLKPGEPVPETRFIDQDGKRRDFASFKGMAIVLTFIYTRCPMPTFCPLMDRQFAAIQRRLQEGTELKGHVHLVTVTFDPATDTPPVLKKHAKTLDADPAMWTFLTGDRDEIDRFAARFGLSVVRAGNDPRDVTHTLRTAIVDGSGRLVKVYTGNEWTPGQILADLEPVARASE